jgi:poly(A) polymerase
MVVEGLRERGHQSLLAGGCVRDELLGRVPSDYDVVTDATPGVIAKIFPRTAEVGAHFGVMLVRVDLPGEAGVPEKHIIEVATFRADGSYTDKRRPDAVHFSSPDADAARRDFTVNALYLDPLAGSDDAHVDQVWRAHPNAKSVPASERGGNGVVIDYVNGLHDLDARVLRAVGDPEARLAEDHLRALRAVRLSAKLGFTIEAATASAITRHAADLHGVSKERIGDEFRMMMEHPSRAEAAETLARLGLLAQVFEGVALEGLRAREFSARVLRGLSAEAVREGGLAGPMSGVSAGGVAICVAALLWDAGLPVGGEQDKHDGLMTAVRKALCLSNLERDRLVCCLRVVGKLAGAGWGAAGVAARKRIMGGYGWQDGLELVRVMDPALGAAVAAEGVRLAADGVGVSPEPILTGDHLVAMGMKPGKGFKDLLDRVYDEQLEGRVRDLEQARELVVRMRV